MTDNSIRIFLADDHTMVREGLAALVARDPGLKVVGQCGDGLQIAAQVKELKPDVVVLDITMPGLNGLDVCRELTRKYEGSIGVLILTMHDDEEFIARALQSGASGYLLKESAAGQLSEAVRAVARREIYLSPGIPRTVLDRIKRGGGDAYENLTTRERQVLQLIAEGRTNRQIAKDLDLSIKTVDTHRLHLMRKLSIHDQTSLVKYALKKGIIPLQ